MSHKQPLFAVVCGLLLLAQQSFANQCTWTGSIDSLWNKSGNWNGGIPSGDDTVTIDAGSGVVCLVANVSISKLTMVSGLLRLQTYRLELKGAAEFFGGEVRGTATNALWGDVTDFTCNATEFYSQLSFSADNINLSGSSFHDSCFFQRTGTTDSYFEGGNHFYSTCKFDNAQTGLLALGGGTVNTYDGDLYLRVKNKTEIIVGDYSESYFNGNIYCRAEQGSITIGSRESPVSVLAAGKQLKVDSIFDKGEFVLINFMQSGTTIQDFTVAGSSGLINMVQCNFSGKSTFTSAAVLLRECEFNDSLYVEKTGSSNDACSGNNRYNANFYFKNSGTGEVILAKDDGDYYTGNATFHTSNTGKIRGCFSGISTFESNLWSIGAKVELNNNNNYLNFTGSGDQHITGTDSVKVKSITINKASGSLYVDTTLVIYDSLLLGLGIIYTNNPLVLSAGSAVSGASNLSFVDGPVKKIGNTAFVFPVGDEGQWNPIEITAPAQASDAFTAQFYLKGQNYGTAKDSTIRQINTCSYWNLTRPNGNSNVNVYLYWDSIACGLYDTLGLTVGSWNGTAWKDIGRDFISGNVMAGKIKSSALTSYYTSFTWGYKPDPGQPIIIPINPVLNINSTDPSWNHNIAEDYFGYNGANVLDPGQYWSDLAANAANINRPVLLHNGISSIRFNGGTYGNYWDWRTSWFIPEDELPNNWFYLRRSYKKVIPPKVSGGTFVNDMQYFKISNDAIAGRPIFQLNNLTSSSINYELASLYRAQEVNIPIKYVELGNEFYLNDEQYKEVYPSSFDYINRANSSTYALKSKFPFENIKVAVVGTSSLANSPGRRSLWLEVILSNIQNVPKRPDAITIHEYYASGLDEPIAVNFGSYNIGKMFIKPFVKGDDLIANELQAIEERSNDLGLNPSLEVWLTEYNMNDDVSHNVGTWAHGLFNAIQTLKYLESPIITRVSSHAMTSDAVYGNIFESDHGFEGLLAGQLPYNVQGIPTSFPTEKYGFTASGAAQNEIALAMKGTEVIAHRIDFSPNAAAIGTITYTGQTTSSNLLNLYGWSFEKEEGFEAVILNLGRSPYSISNPSALTSTSLVTNIPLSMVQLTASDPTAGIGTIVTLPTSISLDEYLYTTGEIEIVGGMVSIPPHSLTRIIYRNPNTITIRLTDDVICEGTSTSVLVQGANHNATITLQISPLHAISGSDSLFILPDNLAPGTYTLTASDGSATSNSVVLTIHPAMNVTASITSGTNTPCADQDIVLTADINTTSSDINNDYTYLWVPDKHIADNNPFQQSITLNNSALTTEAYQVFVFDGQCWASSNLIAFDRGPKSVDLGNNFTVCTTSNFNLRAMTTSSPLVDNGTFHFRWLEDNYIVSGQNSSDFTVQNPGVGSHTYRVEVWSDNGSTNSASCPVWDEVVVNVVNCCSCSSAVELTPHPYPSSPDPEEPVYNISHEGDLITACSTSTANYTVSGVVNNTVTITATSPLAAPICINGEFWVRKVQAQNREIIRLENCSLRLGPDAKIRVRAGAKLILAGCHIQACSGAMWDGICVDITDQTGKEPELVITNNSSSRSSILEAKNAVVLRRDSPYIIEDCDFENNYVDVLIEKYNNVLDQHRSGNDVNDFSQENYIRNCSFTKTATLLTPYTGIQKLTGIRLRDVERVVIGDSSLLSSITANSFSNSCYGIMAYNAGFECYNNTFSNILYDVDGETVEQKYKGSCIYSYSASDFNNRKMIIGNKDFSLSSPAVSHKNIFTAAVNGIVSVGEMNIKIFNNLFGGSSTSDVLASNGISISGSKGKEIYITRENEFKHYNVGVKCLDVSLSQKCHIGNNLFLNPVINTAIPLHYEGTAIWTANKYLAPAGDYSLRLHPLQIFENTIGQNGYDAGPRIGIYIGGINDAVVQNNHINFDYGSPPSLHTTGIWLQMADFAAVGTNEIINTTYEDDVDMTYRLTGIQTDLSNSPCFQSNIINKVGISMRFLGDCGMVKLSQNSMTDYDNAFELMAAEIGTQGAPDRTDNNEWHYTASATESDRVVGTKINSGFFTWYYDASDPKYNPDINSNANPQFLDEKPVNNPSQSPSDCDISPNVTSRNSSFGPLVADTIRYESEYFTQFNYLSKRLLYDLILKDESLVDMGDNSDATFQEFFAVLSTSNMNEFNILRKYIYDGDFDSAITIIESISDTNDLETILKGVYTTICSNEINETNYSPEDSVLFNDWSNINLLLGGEAILLSRINLFREVHDSIPGSGSRIMEHRSPSEKNEISLFLAPNPTQSIVKITSNVICNKIELTDIRGKIVYSGPFTSILNINNIDPGVYVLSVFSAKLKKSKKLIVIR